MFLLAVGAGTAYQLLMVPPTEQALVAEQRQLEKKEQELAASLSVREQLAELHITIVQAEGREGSRFQFPEKPGALLNFLMQTGNRWNISLFHYRNHGSNFGRILMGFQVDRQDLKNFNAFLKSLKIPYWEETDNAAYRLFL